MDVDDIIVLTLALWVFICTSLVKTIDLYITLLLIGLLIVLEVAGSFISPEVKERLKPTLYFLLFVFFLIVVKKVYEVLS